MNRAVAASDILSSRKKPIVTGQGTRTWSLLTSWRRMRERWYAAGAVNTVVRRAFVSGLRDAKGSEVDPATTAVEALCDDAGVVTIRLLVRGVRPVELRCDPGAHLSIVAPDGDEVKVDEWRDLPDLLPQFIGARTG